MENTEKENNLHKIKKQIEYYLSDDNLQHDEFFHNKISENKEGYLPLDLITSCKKVKDANWTLDEIISAINASEYLELDSTSNFLRRKNNKQLPTLQLLNKKRKKENTSTSLNNNKEPIILTIKSNKQTDTKWKDIQNKYKALNPTLQVIYCRFNETEGNIAVIPTISNKITAEGDIDFIKQFELNDIEYTITLTVGNELETFYDKHGSHLDMCVNREKNKKINKKNQTKLTIPLTLGNTIYKDIGQIKHKVRTLLSTNPEFNRLNESDCSFINDLLEYHQDKATITTNTEYYTTGKLDPHNYSKAFFAIGKDKKMEFFLNKCIEKISNENRKKKQ